MLRILSSRLLGLMLVLAGVGAFAEEDIGPAAGHPLARARRSLADLLDQADLPPAAPRRPIAATPDRLPDPAPDVAPDPVAPRQPDRPRPVMRPQPRQPDPGVAGNVVGALEAAIESRNSIVDGIQLFDKLRELQVEQRKLDGLKAVADQAAKQANALVADAKMLAMGDQVAPEAKAAAADRARQATGAANAARGEWQRQANEVRRILDRIAPHVGPWLESYASMRRAYAPDRRDPNRQAVLRVLERAVAGRRDLVEGRVLAGLLHAYEGNAGAAEAHLAEACKLLGQHDLFLTAAACDCCHAYLLLGKPDMVAAFVDMIRGLNPQRQTAARCWLCGVSGMLTGRENEAGLFFQKALAKVNAFKADEAVPPEAAPLLGDAALFRLTAALAAQRNADKARAILERTEPDWDAWQLLRARAALAADEAKWDEAVAQVDRCLESCPGTVKEEVQAQRDAYVDQRPWIRPKPVKVAAR